MLLRRSRLQLFNSFQVDLKACDCFNALNIGIAQLKEMHGRDIPSKFPDSGRGGGLSSK